MRHLLPSALVIATTVVASPSPAQPAVPDASAPAAAPVAPLAPLASPAPLAPPAPRNCRRGYPCSTYGLCTERAGTCVAATSSDCRGSGVCRHLGACTAEAGRCVLPPPEPLGAGDGTVDRSLDTMWGGLGVSLGGVGLGMIALPLLLLEDGDGVAPGLILTATGTTAVLMGVPLMALGASDIPAGTKPANTGLMVGGVVLAGLGTAGTTVTSGAFIGTGEPLWGIPVAVSLATMAGGTIMAAFGAATVPITPEDEADWASAPEIRVGPGGVSLDWAW